MADEKVRQAQRFINTVYGHVSGIPKVKEDGRTGWTTMFALTRCLQYELGITALSNNFGPGTLGRLQDKYPKLNRSTMPSANFCRIIQSALYCKGYDGGEIDGIYNDRVAEAISKLKNDMGVDHVYQGDDLTPKVFKALLNMDPYVLVHYGTATGDGRIREVQQWLNGKYVDRRDFFIIPCDGHHSRDVAKSMLLAIQYELGMADGVANGVFGPGTQAGLKNHPVYPQSHGTWVLLFTAALLLNKRSNVEFSGVYTPVLVDAVKNFQRFVKLSVNGNGDYQTWASLLISHGDQTRKGEACDCVTKITPARADALKAAGYKYVGRYLTNPSTTSLPEKAIQPGELEVIKSKGLRVFPIYQTFGRGADDFSDTKGTFDAIAAVDAANSYGFKRGTRIFFAVDFDALDHEVTSNIIPHFRAIKRNMEYFGNRYQIGIYGPRNVCSRVAKEGLTTASFVSDMSSGFSGNLGYPMPDDWAYDQIATITVGSGAGRIEIDNNITSGRDIGQNSFDPPSKNDKFDVAFDLDYLPQLRSDIIAHLNDYGAPTNPGSRYFSPSECLEHIMYNDILFTELAKTYRMRKALIQTSILWEMMHINVTDTLNDVGVYLYHGTTFGDIPKNILDLLPDGATPDRIKKLYDSSTGVSKMYAETAIKARNHCILHDIINGSVLDPKNKDHIWRIWEKLNGGGKDHRYNMSQVPLVHIHSSVNDHPKITNGAGRKLDQDGQIPRPSLDYPDQYSYIILRRYQGAGEVAEWGAKGRMGLYRIFEKYYAPMRNG
ncbi:glycoside hydrolase domain-containing protein [Streptomyces gobiensis]|uniref:glycoside hydrolase domain-containing protein n=1 Tax=Streptomyces gobiensis TaxID=2875706 RepID=UPI001E61993B|nr:glycoside hydrolase domain-containing protein [Streptomyces gobiensis]UGY91680.1 DUF1906 domain-containing protein [Streptomyces gobiensis]